MGHIQKILLLVLIVPLTLFPGGLITYFLLYEQPPLEVVTLIPIGLSVLGVCSFIFHYKTLKFYKLIRAEKHLPNVEPLLWILDILFGVVYIFISSYLMYLVFLVQSRHTFKILLLFIIPMIFIGLWTVIEAVYLYKMVKIHKFSNRHVEIDEISGGNGE